MTGTSPIRDVSNTVRVSTIQPRWRVHRFLTDSHSNTGQFVNVLTTLLTTKVTMRRAVRQSDHQKQLERRRALTVIPSRNSSGEAEEKHGKPKSWLLVADWDSKWVPHEFKTNAYHLKKFAPRQNGFRKACNSCRWSALLNNWCRACCTPGRCVLPHPTHSRNVIVLLLTLWLSSISD
jgi:hypothetical protein